MINTIVIVILSSLLILSISVILLSFYSTIKIKTPTCVILAPTQSDVIEYLIRKIHLKLWDTKSFSEYSIIILTDNLTEDQKIQASILEKDFRDIRFCRKSEVDLVINGKKSN